MMLENSKTSKSKFRISFGWLLILGLICAGFSPKSKPKVLNLHQVNPSIFRSAQPGKKGFKELEEQGIKSVVSLRNFHGDSRKAVKTNLKLYRVKMRAGTLTNNDLVAGLKAINEAEKPVLIHCLHGADRTGVMIAVYRMVFEDWGKERAIAEMRDPKFGYHEKNFPNLIELLENLDVEAMRTAVGINF